MTTYPIKPNVSATIPDAAAKWAERHHGVMFSHAIGVDLIGGFGGDWLVCDAARVSSVHSAGRGPRELTGKDRGLLQSLVKGRHGAPFSHGSLTFLVEAPIFIFREWRTHKIAMPQTEGEYHYLDHVTDDKSYSEASARYRPLKPLFWIPRPFRPFMVPEDHKAMRPSYLQATADEYAQTIADMKDGYTYIWETYRNMLTFGVAAEVARAVLPVGIYSTMYVTCNPRSLMHFCGLRVADGRSAVPTYPQAEIQEAAIAAENLLQDGWPETHRIWVDNGRQSL